MGHLPSEILVRIMWFLILNPAHQSDKCRIHSAVRLLRPLRLVSHAFEACATPLMFRNTCIPGTRRGLALLGRIAASERHARMVLVLHLSPPDWRAHDEWYDDDDEDEKTKDRISFTMLDPRRPRASPPPQSRPADRLAWHCATAEEKHEEVEAVANRPTRVSGWLVGSMWPESKRELDREEQAKFFNYREKDPKYKKKVDAAQELFRRIRSQRARLTNLRCLYVKLETRNHGSSVSGGGPWSTMPEHFIPALISDETGGPWIRVFQYHGAGPSCFMELHKVDDAATRARASEESFLLKKLGAQRQHSLRISYDGDRGSVVFDVLRGESVRPGLRSENDRQLKRIYSVLKCYMD